ncbi:hypothetical protein GCM10020000_60820 [Streptomyces olivoverticillatus]
MERVNVRNVMGMIATVRDEERRISGKLAAPTARAARYGKAPLVSVQSRLAAVALLTAAAAAVVYPAASAFAADKDTRPGHPAGTVQQVQLPDGSRARLSSGSGGTTVTVSRHGKQQRTLDAAHPTADLDRLHLRIIDGNGTRPTLRVQLDGSGLTNYYDFASGSLRHTPRRRRHGQGPPQEPPPDPPPPPRARAPAPPAPPPPTPSRPTTPPATPSSASSRPARSSRTATTSSPPPSRAARRCSWRAAEPTACTSHCGATAARTTEPGRARCGCGAGAPPVT